MERGLILYETNDRVATITLNRPEFLNALISPMWRKLNECIAEANRNPEVRVIRLRGEGRAFCAGFDFGAAGDTKARNDREPGWTRTWT
jgi:enoyl-CoA hydratase